METFVDVFNNTNEHTLHHLPSELFNVIANFLDMPSLVIFRMVNSKIRNIIYMKGECRPKRWRGQFFEIECRELNYQNLIVYATECGLKIWPQNVSCQDKPTDPVDQINGVVSCTGISKESIYTFIRRYRITKENAHEIVQFARKNSLLYI